MPEDWGHPDGEQCPECDGHSCQELSSMSRYPLDDPLDQEGAKHYPVVTKESWSHRSSLDQMSWVDSSSICASVTSYNSVITSWSIDGAPLFD